ncbi:MAG: MGMT family protein [Smithellaceae bacterium]
MAARIGAPRAARSVGTALAGNPFPIVIPCHRVIRACGTPGRFGGGAGMKIALLEKEGVEMDARAVVSKNCILHPAVRR